METSGTSRGKVQRAYGLCITTSLTTVALHSLTQWDIRGLIPGVMLLKKNEQININVLNIGCQAESPKNPEKVHQLFKPHGRFLDVIQCHVYQHAKALVSHSRGPGAFPKDPVHITWVEGDLNHGEVSWDTLKKKAATYEEGSQWCHPKFSGNNT